MFQVSTVDVAQYIEVPAVLFAAAKVWWDVRYVKRNMVTQEHVENALLRVQKEALEKFRTKEDCNALNTERKNGQIKPEAMR